ncbi:hypothetical protein PPUN110474_27930 [Pseudomonas putida]|nr:hypothetical protein PPUN110474_27930 [Pseudomonas putida]
MLVNNGSSPIHVMIWLVIVELGIDVVHDQHYKGGEMITHKPDRRTNASKVNAVLEAIGAGKAKEQIMGELCMSW